jgi:hypothetical protein
VSCRWFGRRVDRRMGIGKRRAVWPVGRVNVGMDGPFLCFAGPGPWALGWDVGLLGYDRVYSRNRNLFSSFN